MHHLNPIRTPDTKRKSKHQPLSKVADLPVLKLRRKQRPIPLTRGGQVT